VVAFSPAFPPNEVLPISWESLQALLGNEFRHARLTGIARVALRSRNHLYRLRLEEAAAASLVVKLVRQTDDRFWEHHLRREHWVLELLERFWPGGAPRPFAAAFGHGWGLLIMEDVGAVSLAEALGEQQASLGGEPAPPLHATLERLAGLHALLRAQHRPFSRVCRSIELDRITAASLLARMRVAARRLRASAATPEADVPFLPPAIRGYAEHVIRPLVRGPRHMIHNSLSPLNVVLDPAPRFVDWETMALAAPEFDVADLLCYPAVDLPWPAIDRLVAATFGTGIDAGRLRLAALARALDYAGSNAQQAARSQAAGDRAHAATAAARRDWYLREYQRLAADLGLRGVGDGIVG
jgi:hypothetical protein